MEFVLPLKLALVFMAGMGSTALMSIIQLESVLMESRQVLINVHVIQDGRAIFVRNQYVSTLARMDIVKNQMFVNANLGLELL